MIAGGTGINTDGIGLYIHAGGKIYSDASDFVSDGSNYLEADEGFDFSARQHTYVAEQWTKKKWYGKKETHVRTTTDVKGTIVQSASGYNILRTEHGGLSSVATCFASPGGTEIYARDQVLLYSLKAQNREYTSKSSWWGLSKHTIDETHLHLDIPLTNSDFLEKSRADIRAGLDRIREDLGLTRTIDETMAKIAPDLLPALAPGKESDSSSQVQFQELLSKVLEHASPAEKKRIERAIRRAQKKYEETGTVSKETLDALNENVRVAVVETLKKSSESIWGRISESLGHELNEKLTQELSMLSIASGSSLPALSMRTFVGAHGVLITLAHWFGTVWDRCVPTDPAVPPLSHPIPGSDRNRFFAPAKDKRGEERNPLGELTIDLLRAGR